MTIIKTTLLLVVVCSLFQTAAQAKLAPDEVEDGPNIGAEAMFGNKLPHNMQQRGQCKAHSCSDKNKESVHKSLFTQFETSGCTFFGGGSSSDEYLAPCCNAWTACHEICGTTKLFCDQALKRCLHQTCATLPDTIKEKKIECESAIGTYNVFLKIDSCKRFERGQGKGCECVDTGKVLDKRKDVLTKFYKRYSPEGLSKLSTLMTRATDARKFAGTHYAMVSKYPESTVQKQSLKSSNDEGSEL